MTERTLGVGVIGAGGISRFAHLPNLKRNPRVELVAVADINPAKAKQAADDFDIAHSYSSYQELLDDPKVEAVTVTTWPTAHAEPVIAAAKAGKHILCEKPIAPTLAEADAMVDAAEQAGVKFAMGYQTGSAPAFRLVRQLIDEGCRRAPMGMTQVGLGPSAHRVPWFLKKELAGGGVLMDWGIYTAHTILWLMGPVESVYATSAIFRQDVEVGGRRVVFTCDIDVEDTVMATMRFKQRRDGFLVRRLGGGGRAPLHVHRRFRGIDAQPAAGRAGIHVSATPSASRRASAGGGTSPPSSRTLSELHYRKLAHLVDAVLDDQPSAAHGCRRARCARSWSTAVYRSADSGKPVDLRPASEPGSGIGAAARQQRPRPTDRRKETLSMATSCRRIRLAFVGGEHLHFKGLLESALKSPTAEVAGHLDSRQELREHFMKEYSGVAAFAALEELYDKARPEAIMTCADNRRAAEVVADAAVRGVHVMKEKPMAADLALAEQHGDDRGPPRRTADGELADQLAGRHPHRQEAGRPDGEIGGCSGSITAPVTAAPRRTSRSRGPISRVGWGWLIDRETNGGGAAVDFCSYGAAMSRWFMGQPSHVVAHGGRYAKEFFTVEDTGTMILGYPRGHTVVEGSWTQPAVPVRMPTVIYGEDGAIALTGPDEVSAGQPGDVRRAGVHRGADDRGGAAARSLPRPVPTTSPTRS